MKTLIFLFLIGFSVRSSAQPDMQNPALHALESRHPRIYCSNKSKQAFIESLEDVEWKRDFIERKKHELQKYILLWEKDPNWLVSRLQMNWQTKHCNVYLKGGNFSHSDGEAPVATVRFSGTRDWATNYKGLSLEDIEPYFDDKRGYYLENKKTGKKEWVHPSRTGHFIEGVNQKILSIAEDAAFMFWFTGEEKYAKFAEPLFLTYMEGMHHRNPPEVLDESNQGYISGLSTFEVIHEKEVPHLALIYDYLFNYFTQQKIDLSNAIAVFQKWGDQIIKFGIPDNNWNLFQARYLTYIALALDDDANYANGKGQQYYLKQTFDVSTDRQIAIKEALLVYDQETGIWPESPSYSMHVNTTLLEILALLDNVTGENELANFPIIEKAALACLQYLFPSGNNLGFGDSGHGIIPFENLELLIANYQKYNQLEKEQLITSLLQPQIESKAYTRKATSLLQVFFYADSLKTGSGSILGLADLTTPTFYAPNVSMFVQRMGSGDQALMVSTVASYGNHAHANGISMELFANNYVHAPDMGRGQSYWSADFREYYSQMPAHNTVVVDGKSTYPNMRSFHPFSLDNHYPLSGKPDPGFKHVSFAKVSFVEPKTQSDQQRLTAIINTPLGNGYVLDLFRSKKKEGTTQKHEYFYHNLGHSFDLLVKKDKDLHLRKTDELGSKQGDLKAYDYLSDKMSVSLDGDLKALFKIKEDNKPDNCMKVWIKGAKDQTIFSAKSPKSNALSKGTAPKSLIGEKMPTLILRRDREAWTNPFVLVFNPYFEKGLNPIKNVGFGAQPKGSAYQMITVEYKDEITRDLIVASTSDNDVVNSDDFYQKGLLSIVREKENKETPEFIFASGVFQLKYKEWEILSVNTAATVSIERQGNAFLVHSDQAVVLKVPISDEFKPSLIRMFEVDGSFVERNGNVNRSNPNQIEFRLTKPYSKVVIFSER